MGAQSEVTTDGISASPLGTLEELLDIANEWADLWRRCPGATPFQSPDWLIPYWTHLGEGELWTLAFRHNGKLVGLAPMSIYTQPASSERHLILLGTGISDYLDALFEPGFTGPCVAAMHETMESSRELWDAADLQQLRSGSPLLVEETPPGWTGQINVQEVCPVLSLPESPAELPGRVPPRMLEKLRYYRRRIQRLGPGEVVRARLDNFDELYGRFLELHRARWTVRGQEGVLAHERLHRFHREAAHRMLISGTLRLYGMRHQGTIVAALYAFAHNRHTYFYLSGFDPAFAAYSPGTLLIGHAIEQAISEGAERFDFLRGREAYKYMWGAKGRPNFRRQFRHDQVPFRREPGVPLATL